MFQAVKSSGTPFIAIGMRKFDTNGLDEAIKQSREASESYDPVSQTSNIPLSAGTARTYSDTYSGMFKSSDDDKASDT
ncbi:hypothetical protein [Ruegeria sp. HKCCD6604]|uniref:hypothetical protein n=1 Tax=Ruegeria sp. HKCCD6604 TaxID=2683000 RepID=UPI0014921947|nr:hypothetical protein [Ruegeria sp. HKCCD6604]NOC91564.1 hypothetical protein [Ruegeria sp. HKCCD6604]